MPLARSTDPKTSHEAAGSIDTDRLRKTQTAVWAVLVATGPTTDTGLIDAYLTLTDRGLVLQQSPSGIRTRRKELVGLGAVRDTGIRHRLITGRHAIVWEAVTE